MTPHPIGDEEEAEPGIDRVAILVGLSTQADVGLGGAAKPHGDLPEPDAGRASCGCYRSGTRRA